MVNAAHCLFWREVASLEAASRTTLTAEGKSVAMSFTCKLMPATV